MDTILEFMNNDLFLLGLAGFCVLIFLLYVVNCIRLRSIRKEYKEFMLKMGNGTDIKEILDKHIDKINKVVAKNEELERFCINLDRDIKYCVQKVRNIQI